MLYKLLTNTEYPILMVITIDSGA